MQPGLGDLNSGAVSNALGKLVRDFARFAGKVLWLLLALMIAGSIAEGFGLLMIVPLAAVALGESSRLPQWAAQPFETLEPGTAVALAATIFLAAMAVRSMILVWRDSLRGRLEANYRASLQARAAATLAQAGWDKASRIGQAGMQSLLLNDVPRATQCLAHVLDVAVAATFLAVQFALAALLSPALALFALVVLAPALGLLRIFTRRMARSGEAVSRQSEDSTGAGIRLHSGLKAALAQGSSSQFLSEYRSSLGRLAGEFADYARDIAISRQLSAFATAVAAVLLLIAGSRVLDLPFPVLAASLVLFARMSAPAVALLQAAQHAIGTAPAYAAIERRLGPLVGDAATTAVGSHPERLDWASVELDAVSFLHETGGGAAPASFVLGRGQWLGLRGPSAAGKTTLVDLIVGLHRPQQGSLRVDGEPLDEERMKRWRAGVAYVAQDGLVFDDSVAANLSAGHRDVGEDAMWEALRAVGLDSRVRSFSGGLHNHLGEGGSVLSGGERQRLLIARAILRRPTLIILDEATAALDPAAEAAVLDSLRSLASRPAAVLIAHREMTLSHCETVLDIQHPGWNSATELLSQRSPASE